MRDASMKPPRLRGRPTLRPPFRITVAGGRTEQQCIFTVPLALLVPWHPNPGERGHVIRGARQGRLQGTIMQYENTFGLAAMQLLVDCSSRLSANNCQVPYQMTTG